MVSNRTDEAEAQYESLVFSDRLLMLELAELEKWIVIALRISAGVSRDLLVEMLMPHYSDLVEDGEVSAREIRRFSGEVWSTTYFLRQAINNHLVAITSDPDQSPQ